MEKEMGTLNRSKQIKKKYSTQDLLTMKKKKKSQVRHQTNTNKCNLETHYRKYMKAN